MKKSKIINNLVYVIVAITLSPIIILSLPFSLMKRNKPVHKEETDLTRI